MNPLDQLLKDTLDPATADTEADVLTHPDTLYENVTRAFRGRSAWLMRAIVFDMVLVTAVFIVSIIGIVRTEDVRTTVIWATVLLGCAMGAGLLKLWFFLALNRNHLLREIKRLELGVALLSEKLDRNAGAGDDG